MAVIDMTGKTEMLFFSDSTSNPTAVLSSPPVEKAYAGNSAAIWRANTEDNSKYCGYISTTASANVLNYIDNTGSSRQATGSYTVVGLGAINAAGTRWYVPSSQGSAFVTKVAKVNVYDISALKSGTVPSLLSSITLTGSGPLGDGSRFFRSSSLSPDETKLAIIDINQRGIITVDLAGGAELVVKDNDSVNINGADVAGNEFRGDIEWTPDGTQILATRTDGSVGVYTASTLVRTSALFAGEEVTGIAVSRDGAHIAVACRGSKKVYILDGSTLATVQTLDYSTGHTFVEDVVYSLDGLRLYVSTETSTSAGVLYVLDYTNSYAQLLARTINNRGANRLEVAIRVPESAEFALLYDPHFKQTYTANPESGAIKVYRTPDTVANKVLRATISSRDTPALERSSAQTLHLFARNTSTNAFNQEVSKDGGATWAAESGTTAPFSSSTYRFSAWCFGRGGNVGKVRYCVAVTASQVDFKRSTDGGVTWSSAVTATSGLSAAVWFGIAEISAGVLLVCNGPWSVRRVSYDAGRTWGAFSGSTNPFSTLATWKYWWWFYDRFQRLFYAFGVSASQVQMSRSSDGNTWDSAVTVATGLSAAAPWAGFKRGDAHLLALNGAITTQRKSPENGRTGTWSNY